MVILCVQGAEKSGTKHLKLIRYNIMIGNEQLTSNELKLGKGNCSAVRRGFVSYDPISNTLTLNNVMIVSRNSACISMSVDSDVTIILKGRNKLLNTTTTEDNITISSFNKACNVYSIGNLSFKGEGSIDATSYSGFCFYTDGTLSFHVSSDSIIAHAQTSGTKIGYLTVAAVQSNGRHEVQTTDSVIFNPNDTEFTLIRK